MELFDILGRLEIQYFYKKYAKYYNSHKCTKITRFNSNTTFADSL